jgi:hypothetical protein
LTFEAASSSTKPVIVYRYGSARAPSGMVLNPVAEELAGATLLRPELIAATRRCRAPWLHCEEAGADRPATSDPGKAFTPEHGQRSPCVAELDRTGARDECGVFAVYAPGENAATLSTSACTRCSTAGRSRRVSRSPTVATSWGPFDLEPSTAPRSWLGSCAPLTALIHSPNRPLTSGDAAQPAVSADYFYKRPIYSNLKELNRNAGLATAVQVRPHQKPGSSVCIVANALSLAMVRRSSF